MRRRAQERDDSRCLASGVLLSGKKLSPGTGPDASHFSFSLCATGALPDAAQDLEPRWSESA